MDDKYLIVLAVISVVAITGMVIMSVSNASVTGAVSKKIDTVPGTITLLTPADGATGISLTPTLDWTKSSQAEFIVLYVDTNPGFATPLVANVQLKKNERAYDVPPGLLQPGTTYYWRVVTYNNAGASNSATWSFTTQ